MKSPRLSDRVTVGSAPHLEACDVWAAMEGVTFLNFAGHAAMPRVAVEAARSSAEAKATPIKADFGQFFDTSERARQLIARLIGAGPADVALTTGASAGMALIAQALRWRPGDQILIGREDFPSHRTTWEALVRREGVELHTVSGNASSADDVLEAITPETRLVSLSHVDFQSGALLDAARIGLECRRRDVLFLLDIGQSCGAGPMDIAALGADFAVGVGYKYLLGPWGVGFLYVAPQRFGELQPVPWSWLNQDVSDFRDLDYVDPRPADGARRWDAAEMAGPYNINLCAIAASMDVALGLGLERIRAHTGALIDGLRDGLPESFRFISPVDAARRGAFGCFSAETDVATTSLIHALGAARIIVSLRGGRIRVAPHLMNTPADIDHLLDVTRRWRSAYRGPSG